MEYNTTRNHLIMKEYGRNIQKMIEYVLSIQDPDHRQANAMALIELMGTLNPHLRNVEDFRHKLWDHLFLISDFRLDVESPYPIPTRETLKARPERLPYPKKYPRNRHFGKNLEMVIDKAIAEDNPEKKDGFTQCIGNYMKLAYSNWHKESVHDDAIKAELTGITNGQLEFHPGFNTAAHASAVIAATSPNFNTNAEFVRTSSLNNGSSNKKRNFQQQNNFKGGKTKNNNNNKNQKYKNRNK
ncbi:DUF4290 domain-containing protein [Chitinophaga sancti]|uniref:DUF4290 domain-containing protein n=1 Tax=Chitinophaga sancti TaxID=1004 RepID=A0A1K1RIG6_9BACT|nr:DUF4290 domain-containing protein [Chitinophaga sancti]WQD60689.1 DUF4290 domain-containing protein [Chitinophaga sancti]WQG87183.1 DUF4290 domain-containing protein [Chitinophaga sancti]SFW71967.1 protein of unknown function [Chitinophaga sancti]